MAGPERSRRGERIAFHVEGADGSQIAVMDLGTGEVLQVTSGPGWRYSPVRSSDDRWLTVTFAGEAGEPYGVVADA